jgi:adenylate cyclase
MELHNDALHGRLADWLLRKGHTRRTARSLLGGFCRRALEGGIPLWRSTLVMNTLHPLERAAVLVWRADTDRTEEFRLQHGTENSAQYQNSPIKRVFDGDAEIRRRLDGDATLDFPILADIKAEGASDYFVLPVVYGDGTRNAVTFATKAEGGFSDYCLEELRHAARMLGPIFELQTMRSIALNLADTYLGPRTGRRVLDGAIRRGSGEAIRAVVWMCDLRGFTAMSAGASPGTVIGALNDFFDTMAAPVERHGGEILKFIGDAMLAIFPLGEGRDISGICGGALSAAIEAESAMTRLNARRAEAGASALDFGIALHVGEVTYGNIGAPRRLDFTVIGRAVNLASRIESLSAPLGRRVLLSADFARAAGGGFDSLGRHALKGIAEPQEIFAPA